MRDAKILVTGATGQALRPAVEALAADNEVWVLGRFTDAGLRSAFEARGIRTVRWAMGETSLAGLDTDFTYVVHGAPLRGQPDANTAAQANAVGAGELMAHCHSARAFLFLSTFGVYARRARPYEPVAETEMLGGDAPFAPSYPVGKLAGEGTVRAFAAVLGLPATIARLNVCYGPTGWGGLPVELFGRLLAGLPLWLPPGQDDVLSSPISTDDVTAFLPGLLDVASTATTIVNLAGDEVVGVREFMGTLAAEAELEVRFRPDNQARRISPSDNGRRHALLGPCRVGWREGMPAAVEAHFVGAFDAAHRGPIEVAPNVWGQR